MTTVLLVFCATTWGAPKLAEKLVITPDRTLYGLNEAVTGTVKELDVGEKFTLDLVDAWGKVHERQPLKRTARTGTPFVLRLRRFTTSQMYLYVSGASGRTGIVKIEVVPPTAGWERFEVFTTDSAAMQKMTSADALRRLGVRAGLASSATTAAGFSLGNFRVLVVGPSAVNGFIPDTAAAQSALRDFEARADLKDFSALSRVPSLAETRIVDDAVKAFSEQVISYEALHPLGYVLLDAPGVTPGNTVVDFSFDDATLRAFRTWLARRYPSPGALSRKWDVKFNRWDEVRPSTAGEVLERERRNFERHDTLNFAAWAAHREFMDEELSTRVRELTERIRQQHRDVRVGLMGAQPPAAYGGYDWSLLADTVNIIEAVDPLTKRLSASLNRQRVSPGYTFGVVGSTAPTPEILRHLWTFVADGDLGIVLKPGGNLLGAEAMPTEKGYDLQRTLLALDGAGPVLIDREFVPAPTGVYLYYSQPSVRVQWMLDALARGPDFRMGGRADDVWTSTWHRNLLAWTTLLDDLGVAFEFLSYRDAAKRGLWQQKAKVIILPKVLALSEAELTELRRFVSRGGLLIADSQAGLFDEQGVMLKRGDVDALFGVKRDDWRTVELAARLTETPEFPFRVHEERGRSRGLAEGVPVDGLAPVEPGLEPRGPATAYHLKTGRTHALLCRSQDRGLTVYLNLSLINYPWARAEARPVVVSLREILRRTLALAEVRPGATLLSAAGKPLPDVVLRQYRHGNNDFLVVLRSSPPPPEPPAPAETPLTVSVVDDEAKPFRVGTRGYDDAGLAELLKTRKARSEELKRPAPVVEILLSRDSKLDPVVRILQICRNLGLLNVRFAGERPEGFPPDLFEPPPPPPLEPVPAEPAPPDARLLPGGNHATFLAQDVPAPADDAPPPAVEEPDDDAEKKEDDAKKVEIRGDVFKIRLDRERFAYDVTYGRRLGTERSNEVLMFLPEGEGALVALLDYEVTGIDITLTERPQQVVYRMRVKATARPGLHPLRVRLINPKGNEEVQYGTVIPAALGDATGLFDFAVNDLPGEWTLRVTDVLTGTVGETKFTLK
ncbi:MAG TPA: alpha-amylase family protein [Planctomycetota bacterium]|nr:alpha-amylase family protein [Planctomycetota bacterium]